MKPVTLSASLYIDFADGDGNFPVIQWPVRFSAGIVESELDEANVIEPVYKK